MAAVTMPILRTTRVFGVVLAGVLLHVACVAVSAQNTNGGAPKAPADVLGHRWQETESGWEGVWTRRGTSKVFDARWRRGSRAIRAVVIMSVSGSTVTIRRRSSTDGTDCDYKGTIAADGATVQGTYACSRQEDHALWTAASGLPLPWRATIQR